MPDVLTAWFPAGSCLRWESQVEYIIDVDLFQDASALLDSGSHVICRCAHRLPYRLGSSWCHAPCGLSFPQMH